MGICQGGVVTDGLTLRRLGPDEGRKLLLLGDVRTIKAGGADTGGELTVLEQVVAPGAASALHRHAYQEVFYLLEGELEFTGLENGERVTFAVAAGGTVHASPGAPHGYRNAGRAPARFLAIIQPSGADGFFEEVGVWLDEGRPPADEAEPSLELVREAAARHGIEFLPGP
jgi:quercetin dioxygenase-like cupin family protein